MAQQLAHHTVSGCNVRVGDLMGSGTISGTTPDSCGSLLETTRNGAEPVALAGGAQRGSGGWRHGDHDRLVPGRWLPGRLRRGLGEDPSGGLIESPSGRLLHRAGRLKSRARPRYIAKDGYCCAILPGVALCENSPLTKKCGEVRRVETFQYLAGKDRPGPAPQTPLDCAARFLARNKPLARHMRNRGVDN